MKKIALIIVISFLIPSINIFGTEPVNNQNKEIKTEQPSIKKVKSNNVNKFEDEKKEELIFDDKDKKKKKEDFFSFLAPENFIGVMYFLIILGGLVIMKRIFFPEEAPKK